jgi:ribonuclease-3
VEQQIDFKTKLQEFVQVRYRVLPTYEIVGTVGPDHDRVFRADVLIHDDVVASGEGRSKKEAEQRAATVAFESLTKHEREAPPEQ